MSYKAVQWVLDHCPVSGASGRLVMVILAERVDPQGYCWPGIDDIARRARLTTRQVQRTLRQLAKDRHIRIFGGGSGPRSTNGYVIIGGRDDAEIDRIERDAETVRAKRSRVTPVSPLAGQERDRGDAGDNGRATPGTGAGDAGGAPRVTPVSPEPESEPAREPSKEPERADAEKRASGTGTAAGAGASRDAHTPFDFRATVNGLARKMNAGRGLTTDQRKQLWANPQRLEMSAALKDAGCDERFAFEVATSGASRDTVQACIGELKGRNGRVQNPGAYLRKLLRDRGVRV